MKRIVIADDHDVVRAGLRAIIETQTNLEVVGDASNGREAMTLVVKTVPDIAILDYSMPLMDGIEVARQIKAHQLPTQILMFTMHDGESIIREALSVGVRAFLLKSDAKQQLPAAIDSLLSHRPYFTGFLSEKLLESFLANQGDIITGPILSPRERSVVKLIAEGHSNKSMSSILNLSVKTVETHRASAMRKLDINSTAGLVRYAIHTNLTEL
jgi:DNA-binding NarL/FixJ family response regulator